MLSTMVRADGLLVIPSQAEGLSAGEAVEVVLM
jgi:molybdopterin biosynthesis enzyme